jgi:hypothetical protein
LDPDPDPKGSGSRSERIGVEICKNPELFGYHGMWLYRSESRSERGMAFLLNHEIQKATEN